MHKNEKNNKGFISGLLTGGFIGALAALLYAPKSGREFRKDISDKSSEIINDTGELLENAKSKAADVISDVKKKAGNLLEEGKNTVGSITHGAAYMITHGREIMEEEVSMIKNAVRSGAEAFTEERSKLNSDSKDKSEVKSYATGNDKNKFSNAKY